MNEKIESKRKVYISVNISVLILGVLFFIISIALSGDSKYIMRVLLRGVCGLLILYNSMYLLLTDNWSFLAAKASKKKRLIAGVLLGVAGLIGIITSILGYGLNGDPRVLFWS